MIQWGRNWHAPELIRWMTNDATIELSDEGRLQCKAISFRKPRKLIAYLNGELILNDVVPTALTRIEFSVQPGILRLHCPDGGERPCDFPELQNNDTRLLSIAFGEWEYVEPVASFDYRAYPRRLNLGCGRDKRTGYLNVDIKALNEPDLIADVRDLSMLPTGYYDEILAQDVLEHLPRPDTRITLREWYRLLMPGGTIRLRIPDLLSLLQKLESDPMNEWWIQCIYGTQTQEGDFHAAGFTLDLLIMYLKEAGFRDIELVKNDWLIEATATRSLDP